MEDERFFPVIDPDGHTGMINGIAYTPDGKFIITASKDKTVRVWDRFTGRIVFNTPFNQTPVFSTPNKLQDFPFFEIKHRR